MKKLIMFTIIVYIMVIITGCGKKTVMCEGNISEDNMSSSVKVTGKFKNSKLLEQNVEMNFDLTDYLQYIGIDTFYESFIEQYEKFNGYDGIKVNIKKLDTSITVIMDIDLENVDEKTYNELGIGNGNLEVSSKAFINEFTNMGLTCK